MKGFMPSSHNLSRKPLPLLPQCGVCKLNLQCLSPKMGVDGKGRRGILVVGEAPGKNEDEKGKPFVGDSGDLLKGTLREFGIDLRRDCWVTNAVICRPPKNKLPKKAIDFCRPNVVRTIKELNPTTIILLGGSAVRSVLNWLWKEDVRDITRWVGWQIPYQRLNCWICPTWHPSHLLRTDNGRGMDKAMTKLFKEHLSSACSLSDRPWRNVPDYKSKVEVILNPDHAAKRLQQYTDAGNPVAWDLETDRAKPDSTESRIVCCSVSDGKTSIAYPWVGSAIRATEELLRSDIPKVGWNVKFETRWIKRQLGFWVKNWVIDGMLAAHTLDSRRGITSLKFQSFVHLGIDSYDDAIKPFFNSKGGNERNRIREVSIDKLLLYCGIDSLLEYKVTSIQAKQLGIKL